MPTILECHKGDRPDIVEITERLKLPADSVLELGCGDGATADLMRTKLATSHYVGIESAQSTASLARGTLDELLELDVQDLESVSTTLEGKQFDLFLALDVLEHLYNPWDCLAALTEFIRPGGHVVVSIPNVQNPAILNGLVAGHWQYTSEGLLDATHSRFFTLDGVLSMLTGAGLEIVYISASINPQVNGNLTDTGNQITLGRLADQRPQQAGSLQVHRVPIQGDCAKASVGCNATL